MVKLLVIICFFVNVGLVFAQSTNRAAIITTNEGKEYTGVIFSEDSTQIVIIDNGTKIMVTKSQIAKIVYYSDVNLLDRKINEFGSLGLTILQPGIINIVGEYEAGKLGGRLAVGYIGSSYGIQGNFLYNLGRTKSFNHHVSFGAGYSHYTTPEETIFGTVNVVREWQYIGGFYDLNFFGFFVETGLMVGSGDFSNPQIALQLGFVYEFR
ncbi:MAG: hypothetical protein IPM69_06350 [Ignavibacteria bacterium]|nr:hypothetical protein [Ignavibacteria bacterium]